MRAPGATSQCELATESCELATKSCEPAATPSHAFGVALGLFALAGLATCLFSLQLILGTAFLADNQVALGPRIAALVAVILSPVAGALVGWLLAKRRGREGVVRFSSRLLPLLALWTLPVLFVRAPWRDDELTFLLYAGAVALVLERLFWRSFRDLPEAVEPGRFGPVLGRIGRWLPPLAVGAVVLWYFIAISHYTLLNHERLATMTADLGEFDNLFFNALHGRPFRAPATDGDVRTWSALKVHAEFLLYALLPFYAIAPGPRALLVLQTALVALTAVPIYLFAARRLGRALAAVLAIAMLLLPATQQPNFYDFHFHPIGMLCAAWLIYAIDVYLDARARAPSAERPWRHPEAKRALVAVIIASVLTMLAREDVAFGVAIVGLVLLASGKAVRLGLGLFVAAAIYFCSMKFVVMPLFGKMWFSSIYQDLWAPGAKGFGAIILTLVTHPAYVLRRLASEPRLLYLLHLSVPLAFLWFRKPWLLVAALPALPFSLLATNRPPLNEISFQYVYGWIPYVFAASALGLASLGSARRRWAAALPLCIVAVACSFQFGALLGAESVRGGFHLKALAITDEERERAARLAELVKAVPPDASVAATSFEGPHLSTRLDFFPMHRAVEAKPEYLLTRGLFEGREGREVRRLLDSRAYGVVEQRGEFTLFRRGADPSTLESLLKPAKNKPRRGS